MSPDIAQYGLHVFSPPAFDRLHCVPALVRCGQVTGLILGRLTFVRPLWNEQLGLDGAPMLILFVYSGG